MMTQLLIGAFVVAASLGGVTTVGAMLFSGRVK